MKGHLIPTHVMAWPKNNRPDINVPNIKVLLTSHSNWILNVQICSYKTIHGISSLVTNTMQGFWTGSRD